MDSMDKESKKPFIPPGMPKTLLIGVLLGLFVLLVVGPLMLIGVFFNIPLLASFTQKIGLIATAMGFVFMALFNLTRK